MIAPKIGENGKPTGYLGVRYDITEAETERQNMKGVLRAIDSSFAYAEFTNDGHILSINGNMEKLLGYTSAEAKNQNHSFLLAPIDRKPDQEAQFWRELASGSSRTGIFKRLSKDGKELWLQSVYSPVTDEMGRVFKIVCIATDVTKQQIFATVEETAGTLAAASAELTATATQMSNTADHTRKESLSAAEGIKNVASGMASVSKNMDEMFTAIKEISRSANESAEMSKAASQQAQETNLTVSELGASSEEIGEISKVISSIAQQTNLLALNATIEAARAGDAGKGFSVVANEVKELAKQTAKATQDISNKILAIQKNSSRVVDIMGAISVAIDKMNGISSTIASAVEEQTATTNEVSRVVKDARENINGISLSINTVSSAAEEGSTSAGQTLDASKDLNILAEKLSSIVKTATAD